MSYTTGSVAAIGGASGLSAYGSGDADMILVTSAMVNGSAVGLGGGGMFASQASSATPDSGMVVSQTDGADGYEWIRVFDGDELCVANYPIDSSGAVDSSAYLNAAITFASAAVGKSMIVTIPAGRYLMGEGLALSAPTYGSLIVRGAGIQCTFLVFDTATLTARFGRARNPRRRGESVA